MRNFTFVGGRHGRQAQLQVSEKLNKIACGIRFKRNQFNTIQYYRKSPL